VQYLEDGMTQYVYILNNLCSITSSKSYTNYLEVKGTFSGMLRSSRSDIVYVKYVYILIGMYLPIINIGLQMVL